MNPLLIRIEILDGPEAGVSHSFLEASLRLGAAMDSSIRLTGPGVSAFHALLEVKEGQGRLLPQGEGGEIFLNGSPVGNETLLQPGDVIRLGEQSFRYKLIPFPHPEKSRKMSVLEWVTYGTLALGLGLQFFLLLGPARSLRSGIETQVLREPEAFPPEAPPAPPPPTPTPVPQSLIVLPTPQPTAAAADLPSETTQPPLPADLSTKDLTEEARRLSREGDELQAERYLKEAMRLDPENLEAKAEWARMLGRQASFAESAAVWEEIMKKAEPGSALQRDARLERGVMLRRASLLTETVPENPVIRPTARPPRFLETPEPGPTPVSERALPPAQINVGRIRMERFPDSPRYDALRMIHFFLEHEPGTPAVEAGKIKTVVNFYEQVDGKVIPARIPEPRIVLNITGGLSSGGKIENLSAAYDVPAGTGSPDREYFGVVIQVFVDGVEINRGADPAFLLQMMK
ncbi:MAG: FHA domain-containing protein [Kiritimatiellia bacterium]